MRKIGHVSMWLGFLAAAFVTTRQLDTVQWSAYVIATLVGVVGVVILRRTASAAASHVEIVRTNIATLESSLSRLTSNLDAMNTARSSINVYDVHKRIDAELSDDLASFADARESMIHGIGLQEYANVMDHFARGERAINRSWSASADGYIDEVWQYMELAEQSLREADRILQGHLNDQRAGTT